MSEAQQKLANQVQGWYRDAYKDKDERGIFDKMEKAELYWEGEAKEPLSDNDPASNTNIVNSAIEGQVAYLVEQNISIEAKARGPSDLPFRDNAVVLMEFCKEQNKMRRKVDVHERRRKKFGVGVLRVLFNPDALDGLGLPEIEAVHPAYVYPDPIVHDVYKINEGRFLIEVINRSIESAREKYGDELADAIEPGYAPEEFTDLHNESTEGEIAGDYYIHFLVWTHGWKTVNDEDKDSEKDEEGEKDVSEKRKVLRLIEMSACGVILRDTEEDNVEICEDDIRFPYFFTPDMQREGTVWAKSTAELLIPVQDSIDDIEDQIVINARLTGNPQRLIGRESNIDPNKASNEPGLGIPTEDMNGYKYVTPPSMPQYIINYRNQKLQIERTIVSRWSDQMNGIKQSGVDTATESLGLQQAGTQSITHDKMLLEETLSEVFTYCLTLMIENYTETEVFSITERPDEFIPINASELRKIPVLLPASEEYKTQFRQDYPDAESVPQFTKSSDNITKRIALDISVSVGAGLPSNKAFVFQMIQGLQGKIPDHEYLRLLKDYTGLPIEETQTQPPQQPMQPMQNPVIQGLTQGGNPMGGGQFAV